MLLLLLLAERHLLVLLVALLLMVSLPVHSPPHHRHWQHEHGEDCAYCHPAGVAATATQAAATQGFSSCQCSTPHASKEQDTCTDISHNDLHA